MYSYTDNGWMKQSTYIDAMEDLVKYIKENKIKTPVLYFIDGASCHLSLEMAEFCNKHGIQPILLRPNTTHLTQALDLTFFASLKAHLKQEQELWHRNPLNIGASLTKYSVIPLVHKVTEFILQTKPQLISKGFRKAGICPWNPNAPSQLRMLPSKVYEEKTICNDQQPKEPFTKSSTEQDNSVIAIGIGETSSNSELAPSFQENITSALGSIKSEEIVGQQSGINVAAKEKELSDKLGDDMGLLVSKLPQFTPRFLAKFELLLSEDQIATFNKLFVSKEFKIDNPQYQAWLTLKKASLPLEERNAVEQVITSN